ncbi:MAG: hypothetical protein IPK06_14950 [Ignavibacteriae bacterium]|nr:hypothetical protein [Ignavibacteriota bacterium]
MNRLVLREAVKYGFLIKTNSIFFQDNKININTFLIEMKKLQFIRSVHSSFEMIKMKYFKNDFQEKELNNE